MLKHNHVGDEHILLGLLREEKGLDARVLEGLDIAVERVRSQVMRVVGCGDEVTSGQIPFTPRVKNVLELAVHEAQSLGHNDIGPEHILLGLVRENEGIAARILLDLDADYERIRNEVIGMLSAPAARDEGADRSGPTHTRAQRDQDVSASCDEPALTDALTGLAKHRAWDDGLRREFARAQRRGEPLCVALLDIHDLKRVSDQWGHPAGGEVLRQIARTCRTLLGAGDRAVHYGGDELAVTLPGMPAEVAFDVVERLRRALPAGLTCSAGLASSAGVRSAGELVERADNALYEAKRIGRKLTLIARRHRRRTPTPLAGPEGAAARRRSVPAMRRRRRQRWNRCSISCCSLATSLPCRRSPDELDRHGGPGLHPGHQAALASCSQLSLDSWIATTIPQPADGPAT